MRKKKPNYKLRRNIAKTILVLIIIVPIFLINKTKFLHAPLYISNLKYASTIDALYDSNYNTKEIRSLMNYLKNKKKIDSNTKDYIKKMDDMGYSKNAISYVLKNLNKSQKTDFLARKYNKDFEEFIKIKYFNYKKYDRYLKYQKKNKKLNIDDIVTRIELNLDKEPYEDTTVIKNPDDITALVNKYRELPEDYEPKDLVNMDSNYANNTYGQKKLRKEAYEKFVEMCDTSRKDGVNFYAESAYRSHEYQSVIYKNYVYDHSQEEADKYAAKAGYSEHELGLAVDLANIWTITTKGEEYAWLNKNAYKYGYIIRYKNEWEDITGCAEEAWHIRYVGVKAATIIHKKNITYEEYYIKYIENK